MEPQFWGWGGSVGAKNSGPAANLGATLVFIVIYFCVLLRESHPNVFVWPL